MQSENADNPAFRWRTVAALLLLLAVVAYAAWAARKMLHARHVTGRVTEYQLAYLQRMRDVEAQLARYHAEFGDYPKSMDQWVRSKPDATKLLDPITNAAAPFELRLELLSYPERVLIAIEPGVLPGQGEPVWYIGSGLFNTPPGSPGEYTADDVARTRAAIEKLKKSD